MKSVYTILSILAASVCMFGCATSSFQSPDQMYSFSQRCGETTAAIAISLPQWNANLNNTVYEVVSTINLITPQTNQSYVAAWTPAAGVIIDKYIAQGKLNPTYKPIVLAGVSTIASGMDYLFIKHPEFNDSKIVVSGVIKAYTGGVLNMLNPVVVNLAYVAPIDDQLKADINQFIESQKRN